MALYFMPQSQWVRALPEQLQLMMGQEYQMQVNWPLQLTVTGGDAAVLSSGDQRLGDVTNVTPNKTGSATLSLSLLGLVPVKSVSVKVQPERVLVPGGQAIGVALKTDGVMVVGTSDLGGPGGESPARLAGVKPGDIILSVDGVKVQDKTHLAAMANAAKGKSMRLSLLRGQRAMELSLTPKLDAQSGTYRMGIWARDSTAGVGTLSFYDPATNRYGALGHAISDIDTGVTLPVAEGSILQSTVVGIRRGERGTPGEIQGSFLRDRVVLGDIRVNNSFGIYGAAHAALPSALYPHGLPVASQINVHTGPATILTTLDGGGVKEYAVEITRVARQSGASQKSMTVRVTDPALLEKTGGIVQGMSGSPIVQDGHIVGAITHVFVNDPTQGYGVFIEWMLEQSDNIGL